MVRLELTRANPPQSQKRESRQDAKPPRGSPSFPSLASLRLGESLLPVGSSRGFVGMPPAALPKRENSPHTSCRAQFGLQWKQSPPSWDVCPDTGGGWRTVGHERDSAMKGNSGPAALRRALIGACCGAATAFLAFLVLDYVALGMMRNGRSRLADALVIALSCGGAGIGATAICASGRFEQPRRIRRTTAAQRPRAVAVGANPWKEVAPTVA